MTLQEIKTAIAENKTVCWSNEAYEVIKDNKNQYLIKHANGSCIGLTWSDEKTMNGKEKDFYILGENNVSLKTFYFTIREFGFAWDQTIQKSIDLESWESFASFCNFTSKENGCEVRGCETAGYNNQGHYFYNC